jgi:hypothetical protein
MPKIIDPLRALVQSAQQDSNDMLTLTALLHSTLIITNDRASLSEVAYRLFSKVEAHPCDCVSHAQAISKLRELSDGIATHINKIADSYEQHSNSMGKL